MNLHERDLYTRLGQSLSQKQQEQLQTQLSVFRSALVNFANDHGQEIELNSEFRTKFTQLCLLIGVDPLDLQIHTSAGKIDDNKELALAVRIVEVCHQTREINGGLISLKEIRTRLEENDLESLITEQTIQKGLSILKTLGEGYEILHFSGNPWLKFTNNVSVDHRKVYELCEFMGGFVTYTLLRDNYQWDKVRCKTVIDEMIMNGFLWVDLGCSEWQYWEPSSIANKTI